MNLPNKLTLARLVLVALLLVLLTVPFPYAMSLALLVFIVASVSDYLDGYLARRVYGESAFGRLMDPLADKVMVCAAFVSFVDLGLVPAYIVVIIISREFLVTGLRLLAVEKREIIPAGKWGKHKTVWQIAAIIVILLGLAVRHDILGDADAALLRDYDLAFEHIAYAVSIAVALITVGSGYLYFMENRELIRRNL